MADETLEDVARVAAAKWLDIWNARKGIDRPFVEETIRAHMTHVVGQRALELLEPELRKRAGAMADRLVGEWLKDEELLPPPSADEIDALESCLYSIPKDSLITAGQKKLAQVYRIMAAGGNARDVMAIVKVKRPAAIRLMETARYAAQQAQDTYQAFHDRT